MKKVLIISSTLRTKGNSEILANEFARGAREGGNKVEVISLGGKKISFCQGCLTCQRTGQCIIKDDANEIVDKMLEAEVIVFATPVYFYEMSGQLKTLLDRSNPNFPKNYAFRDIYLIATAADNSKEAIKGTINGVNGWIECFDNVSLKGVVYGVGVSDVKEVTHHESLLKEAFEMGKNI